MRSKNTDNKNLHSGHRQRVKANVVKNGFSQLEDHQLLELMLFYSIPREDTNPIAHRLIDEFGSLDNILSAEISKLQKVQGVGENTALMIATVGELHRRASRKPIKKKRYKTTDDLKELCVSRLQLEKNEKVMLYCFDGERKLLRETLICEGTEYAANVDLRKIISNVIDSNSVCVMLSHNHPTGSSSPSAYDIDSTRSLCVMLRGLGYKVIDHIIVSGDGEAYSMQTDPRFSQLFY